MVFCVRTPQYLVSHTTTQRTPVTRHRLSSEKVNCNLSLERLWKGELNNAYFFCIIKNVLIGKSSTKKCWTEIFMQMHYASEVHSVSRRSNSIPWCTSIHVILSTAYVAHIISNLQHAWSEDRSQCSMWMVSKHVSVQQLLLLRLSSWLIFTVL